MVSSPTRFLSRENTAGVAGPPAPCEKRGSVDLVVVARALRRRRPACSRSTSGSLRASADILTSVVRPPHTRRRSWWAGRRAPPSRRYCRPQDDERTKLRRRRVSAALSPRADAVNVRVPPRPPRSPRRRGGVPEWSIGAVSKTVVPLRVPWVRIPPPPPLQQRKLLNSLRILGVAIFQPSPQPPPARRMQWDNGEQCSRCGRCNGGAWMSSAAVERTDVTVLSCPHGRR
jgi:hypothetical protein